jgi:hypothetical protein
VLKLLRQEGGTTLADIAKAPEWQNRSIRGFLSASWGKDGTEARVHEGDGGERTYLSLETPISNNVRSADPPQETRQVGRHAGTPICTEGRSSAGMFIMFTGCSLVRWNKNERNPE